MNSWLSPGGGAGAESSRSPHPSVPQSPANVVFQPTARRRENVVQPPAITTSLSGLQHQGLGLVLSTPLSTTSLSSPFSHSQASYVSSPGGAVRGSSPMALRLTSPSYTVPYNPQEWGPVGHVGPVCYLQPNNGIRPPQHIPLQRPLDIVPSPPPPYSPPANRQQSQDTTNQGNPAETTPIAPAPSQYTTPTSSGPAAIPLEAVSRYSMPAPRPRPLSLIQLTDGDSSPSFLPPPPPLPPGNQASRSSSGNGSERHGFLNNLSSFGRRSRQYTVGQTGLPDTEAQPTAVAYADQIIRPPSSKRAASTGAIHNNHAWMTTTPQSRSPPRQSWEAGMPLPPPPPGPPPVSNTQNAGVSQESTRHLHQPTSLPQNRSPPVLGTRLDRIPPTPADWVDEETSRDRLTPNNRSLHIDTTNVSTSPNPAAGPNSLATAESSSSSQRPSSGLFRSAAIRDSSVKGIRERRIESRHIRHQVSEDHSAVSPSLNPWADALTMSPSHLVLPTANNSEAHRRVPKPSQLSAGSASSDDPPDTGRSRTSSGLFSNKSSTSTPRPNPSPAPLSRNGFAHTPPFSPGGEPHSPTFAKEAMYAAPPKALPTPPPHSAHDLKPPSLLTVRNEDRPVSHLFHLPRESCIQLPSGPTDFRSTSVRPYLREHQEQQLEGDPAIAPELQENEESPIEDTIEGPTRRSPTRERRLPSRFRQNLANLTIAYAAEPEPDIEAFVSSRFEWMTLDKKPDFTKSRQKELDDLLQKGVFQVVSEVPKGARLFGSRFVDEIKNWGTDKTFEKSRLVIQAYNDIGKKEVLTQSPTIQRASQRLILCLATLIENTDLYLRDISQAYVQPTTSLNRDFYVKPPQELKLQKGLILRVVKSLYGIPEAGNHWFKTYHQHHLDNLHVRPSTYDPCLLYVNDFNDKKQEGLWSAEKPGGEE